MTSGISTSRDVGCCASATIRRARSCSSSETVFLFASASATRVNSISAWDAHHPLDLFHRHAEELLSLVHSVHTAVRERAVQPVLEGGRVLGIDDRWRS